MKKNIIILESAPGARLTNQLWNFASIYAYCLEKGFNCKNHSFFEYKRQPNGHYSRFDYNDFFDLPKQNWLNRFILFFQTSQKKFRPYNYYVRLIKYFFPKQIIYSDTDKETSFHLPPTENLLAKQHEKLKLIEISKVKNVYFCGWLFRNPVGLKKYHQEIKQYFQPKKETSATVNNFMRPLREKYRHIVGVHIRQTDYKTYRGGDFFFKQEKIKEFLEDYLRFFNQDQNQTLFILCSDGPIDTSAFSSLNIQKGPGESIEDFFVLSQTDIIIGSDSTFGAFAAYLGNIPFVIFEKDSIEWEYYKDKKEFFENKKCLSVHF
jgi:hypothetical protein